jgi:hypothetical protein
MNGTKAGVTGPTSRCGRSPRAGATAKAQFQYSTTGKAPLRAGLADEPARGNYRFRRSGRNADRRRAGDAAMAMARRTRSANRESGVGPLLFVLILSRLIGILRCFLPRGLDGHADFRTNREVHHAPAPFFRKVVRIAFNAKSNPFHRSFAWNISQSAVDLQYSVSRWTLQGHKADAQYGKTASRHRS